MLYSRFLSLLTSPIIDGGSSVIGGGGGSSASAAPAAADATAQAASAGAAQILMIVVMYSVLFGVAYLFWFRPQRKREKERVALQKSLGAGDNVVTSAGLYGKIVAVGEDVFVVEFGTNRGVRIPINKADIVGIRTPKLTPQSGTEIPPETPEKLKKPEKESK